MSTGNIENAYRMFERSVRKNGVNLSAFDTLSLRTGERWRGIKDNDHSYVIIFPDDFLPVFAGDPFVLIKVLRALIFETYPQVSRLL